MPLQTHPTTPDNDLSIITCRMCGMVILDPPEKALEIHSDCWLEYSKIVHYMEDMDDENYN